MMRVQLPSALTAGAQVKEAQAECAPFQAEGNNMHIHRGLNVCAQCGAAAVQCWTSL